MENDPIYLSQALTCEASLGVLSVAEKLGDVNFWLAFGLEKFFGLFEVLNLK